MKHITHIIEWRLEDILGVVLAATLICAAIILVP